MIGWLLPLLLLVHPESDGEPPKKINAGRVFSFQDYPTEALQRNEYGITSVRLHITAKGVIDECIVTETSGFPILDSKTCSLIKARGRFKPATDARGTPIDGDYHMATSWGVGANQPRTTSTVTLLAQKIPTSYQTPADTMVLFGVDGRVAKCTVQQSSGSEAADKAACAYITAQLAVSPPQSKSGEEPAIAVRYVTVSLTIDANSTKVQ
ncbi:energy transducer TonB [Sphingobium aquiterrae]|uniref:energy transducer TonB n=1 Tax=Sphingobium aquiterrae TaxID=2038656 RepID=UPI003016DA65